MYPPLRLQSVLAPIYFSCFLDDVAVAGVFALAMLEYPDFPAELKALTLYL